jgi:hypothetical protein
MILRGAARTSQSQTLPTVRPLTIIAVGAIAKSIIIGVFVRSGRSRSDQKAVNERDHLTVRSNECTIITTNYFHAGSEPNLFCPLVPRSKQSSNINHNHPTIGTRITSWNHPDRLRSWHRFAPTAIPGHNEANSNGTMAALKSDGGTNAATAISMKSSGKTKCNK